MLRWSFIFLSITFSQVSLSQSSFQGRVLDAETGEGLIGAHVYSLTNWRNGTISGIDGFFTVKTSSENDSLVVSYIGFEERVVSISNKNIFMYPMKINGEEVVITAQSPVAEEFKYMKIKKLDIYTNPVAKADPLLAVHALPSSTTTDESASISLRGSSPAETGIFLNGVPLYDGVRYAQLNGVGTFSLFNTSIIKDVTVFPGNPPLEYGNTTSGVVSLTTDDKVLKESSNSAILSMANLGFSRNQRLSKKASMILFSNWQPSKVLKAVNRDALNEIASFQSVDLGIYAYGGSKKLAWKVLNYSITEGYAFHFQHPSFQGLFNQRKKRTFLTHSLEMQMGPGRLVYNQLLSASDGEFNYSNAAFNLKKRDFFSGINYVITKETYALKAGIAYDERNASVDGVFHRFSYALSSLHPVIARKGQSSVRLLEGFSYLKVYMSDHLSMGIGVRKNVALNNQSDHWSGQLNFAFVKGAWTLTAGAGSYYKYGLL
ncbi:MAG: carboxypeptidase-like regulatory domain-containing protein, partial [Bacteroidota bacterium]